MSLSCSPHEELREPMPLPEILGGTSFVSPAGRIYRLFGNEETISVPEIPTIPSFLVSTTTSPLSLEEALQKIGTYFSPAENPPTLQLFQAPGKSVPLKPGKNESPISQVVLPAREIVEEVSKNSWKPKDEKRKSLRVIFDIGEEPFIVPFAKPTVIPEKVEDKIQTKNIALKIVTEVVPTIHLPSKIWRYRQRRIEKVQYRKPFSLPPVPVLPTENPPVVYEPKPNVDVSTFRWSAQLDSLMQTASNQIRMLTDHLVVQSNQEIKAICFKSVFPGDGCSTILLCAVRALTERKMRVLLIDAHFRHIDIPTQLNLSGDLETGNEVLTLHEYLGVWVWRESTLADENMTRLAEIIKMYRKEYDIILVDSGSITESPLTEFVGFWNRIEADGIILVSNTKHPPGIPVSHIAERLRQHRIHLIGITENCV